MAVELNKGSGLVSVGVTPAKRAYVENLLAHVRNGARDVLRSAVNETARYARTQLTREIKGILNLPTGEIRDRIKITKLARGNDIEARLRISYKPVPLQKFKPSAGRNYGRNNKAKGRGVTAKTILGESPLTFRHAFRATMASGHVGIFTRDVTKPKSAPSKGRYAGRVLKRGPRKGQLMLRQAVNEVFGVSILVAFTRDEELVNRSFANIANKLQERIASKIDWKLADKPLPTTESQAAA